MPRWTRTKLNLIYGFYVERQADTELECNETVRDNHNLCKQIETVCHNNSLLNITNRSLSKVKQKFEEKLTQEQEMCALAKDAYDTLCSEVEFNMDHSNKFSTKTHLYNVTCMVWCN